VLAPAGLWLVTLMFSNETAWLVLDAAMPDP
jgi:hypothetical protein